MTLSIITVNYNNTDGLEKTIQSVVFQTYTDYEFIIIDGDSTDGSKDIINTYIEKIDYCVSEPDNGIYHAMNKGINEAKGDYCLFLNSGDFLIDENVLYKIFHNKNYNNIPLIRGNQITDYKTHQERWINFGDREVTLFDMYTSSFHHQATFIKRDLFKKYGLYNENYYIVSDWEFTVKLVLKDVKSIYRDVDIVVYDYGGTSSNPDNRELKERERKLVIDNIIPKSIQTDYDRIIELKHKETELIGYNPLISLYSRNRIFRLLFRIINKFV